MIIKPENFFLTAGKGKGEYPLIAFDNALKDAKISDYNLLKVSSILPNGVKEKKIIDLPKGSIIFIAYSYLIAEEGLITSACSVAIPQRENDIGVIMEFSGNVSKKEAEEKVKEMAEIAMKERNILIKKILVKSKSIIAKKYSCVISGCCLW
ncbi:MAG: arginine decarboxylase, pyruvoyl-dependent [candidate division WOR-3 bacterium]